MKIFIGNDLVFIPRLAEALQRKGFIEKNFHPEEIQYCQAQRDQAPFFAARFAAKEALSKALGTGFYTATVGPKDVWVTKDDRGKPLLNFSQKLTSYLQEENFTSWDVSLSHHVDYALATITLLQGVSGR